MPETRKPPPSALNALVLFMIICFIPVLTGEAQKIDILLKGGHVIDAKNEIDTRMDVAIADGKIVEVSPSIHETEAKKVIDASGCYVAPGLIDLHTHVFVGSKSGFADGFNSVSPDDITLKAGITTVVDAGTSGCRGHQV